ncbi:MAG: type II toxin-antitoxin system RelE/ParE family toxin [Oscillospiraceae bacterium]|jgi:plasmid stabilization system protein ParE|nr:type II toxin-antitoxin system RelE/ParE family toxin [Oscillospiraceae bacterium]
MPCNLIYASTYNDAYSDIIEYLLTLSPNVASNFNSELKQQIISIADFPGLYPRYENSESLGVKLRKMVLSGFNYIVFYEISEDRKTVTFFDIVHTSRDIQSVLSQQF